MRVRVTSVASVGFVLIASLGASAQSKKSTDVVESPPIHAFSVTLVVGEMQGALTPDNLPIGARKALSDMRDFLPYKSFRMLDTQFIRCCASMQPEQVKGRLRGVDDQPYPFFINVNYPAGRVSIHFSLQESAARSVSSSKGEPAGDEDPIKDTRKTLEIRDALQRTRQEIDNNRRRLNSQEVSARDLSSRLNQLRARKTTAKEEVDDAQRALDEIRKEITQLKRVLPSQESEARELELKMAQTEHNYALAAQQRQLQAMSPTKSSVIDSTFSMDVGETVVIGTSSLKGDKALIALLTAVRRPDAAQGEKK